MFPLLQLFLLILTTLLCHIGITNPNPSYAGDYNPHEGVDLKFMTSFGPTFGKLIIWTSTLYQVLYLYFQASSQASFSILFPSISMANNLLPFTPISVLGYIFTIVGGLGRIWCYKTLGRFFTFKLTIRSSHKLIKTGPYAYVRHPSYTFVFIMMIGLLLVHQRLANFFPNTKWVQNLLGLEGSLICCIMVALILTRRVIREEEELKKKFGKEWSQYASQTKRFIPGLI